MALEESTDGLEKEESNSITVYLDGKLKEFLEQTGIVTIDFQSYPSGGGGYMITVGGGCDTGSCGGSC